MLARKIIAILQPVYLPWLGFFEQMAAADLFVFLDDVQYTRHDWRNRNRIKTASGSIWLTVPVRKHPRAARIHEIKTHPGTPWPRRHLRSIEINYCKCPHFEPLFSELQSLLTNPPEYLLDLDCRLIALLCRHLKISTPTVLASDVPRSPNSEGDKDQRILEICRYFEADLLYDGAKAADFLDCERFRRARIQVAFQDYRHPEYPQAFGSFLSHQSAIDLIMNTGPEAPAILRTGGGAALSGLIA